MTRTGNDKRKGVGTGWRAIALFTVLCFLAMLPVLWVDWFFATDVPAHLHSAHLFNGLLSGDGGQGVYALNATVVPNSLGHWMMAILLLAISPVAASKVSAAVAWIGFAASVPFLRHCVRGSDGLETAALFGAVLSFNFLWILGLYNFLLGAALCLVSIGLLYRWDGGLSLRRALGLALLASLVFFGHLVAFGVLLLAALTHFATHLRKYGREGTIRLAAAFLPSIVLLIVYQLTKAEDNFAPRWLIARLGLTLNGILNYLKQTDPFTVIGDHNVAPFVSGESPFLLIASPSLWVAVGVAVLAFAALKRRKALFEKGLRGPLILFVILIAAAIVSPDDLGPEQGSILRQRMVLMSLALFAPLFAVPGRRFLKAAAFAALGIAFALQTAALWEYSLKYDVQAKEFLAVERAVENGERVASVLVIRDDSKFQESGVKRISSILGITRNAVVWDNYETGFSFFPVIAANRRDRIFIRALSSQNTFRTRQKGQPVDRAQLGKFRKVLESKDGRIDKLILWGRDPEVEEILKAHFETETVYQDGSLRVYEAKR